MDGAVTRDERGEGGAQHYHEGGGGEGKFVEGIDVEEKFAGELEDGGSGE